MKYIIAILTSISTLATNIFIWMFLKAASLPYNTEGRYFNKANGEVYHEQATEFYGFMILIFVIITVLLFFWLKKLKQKP